MTSSALWSRRIFWLVLDALTVGLIYLVISTLVRVSLGHSVWWFGGLLEAILMIIFVGACSLPSLATCTLVMLQLAKRRRMSFLAPLLIGGGFGLSSIVIVKWAFIEVSRPTFVDITAGLVMGAIPAVLFWRFVVRKERQMAERKALDAAAIAAME